MKMFQPGRVLHDVIVGAFRSNGSSFRDWCRANGVNMATARNATFGMSNGAAAAQLRARIIASAGLDVVELSCRKRMTIEAEKLRAARGRSGAAA